MQTRSQKYTRNIFSSQNSMKLFFLFLIVCIIIPNTNQVFAWEKNTPELIQYNIPKEYITQAKLIKSYIIRYATNINESAQEFDVWTHIFIRDTYIELKNMKNLLEKIQNKELPTTQSKKQLTIIVKKLKDRNIKLQSFFETQRQKQIQEIARKKIWYNAFVGKLSGAINTFIEKLTKALLKEEKLSSAEKNIAKLLLKLREENSNLKAFRDKSFSSEQDMKYYLQKRILNIRSYISNIKEFSR